MHGPEPFVELNEVNLVRPILHAGTHHRLSPQSAMVGGKIDHDHNKTSIHALRDITLTVPSGVRLGIIGPNGSGKTSLLRVIAGIYQPTSGTRVVHGRVGALLSGAMGLDSDTTGRDSIRFVGELYGVQDAHTDAFIDEVSEFSGLGEFLEFPIRTYSAGMRTRLGLSIVTGIRPDILILDEVLSTGDRAFRKHARERVVQLATSVKILVLASHSIADIQEFCDRAIYLEQGHVKYAGSCEDAWACYLERSATGPAGAQPGAPAAVPAIAAAPRPVLPAGQAAATPSSPGAAKPANQQPSRAERLIAAARKVGVPEPTVGALGGLTELPELEALSLLFTHAPKAAREQIARAELEARYGRDGARLRFLAIALFQVPDAEARRTAKGLDPQHTEATLADLGVWARHFLKRGRFHGITLETLRWAQRYLTGDLTRIGAVQFDIAKFTGDVRAYRHPSTRELSVVSLEGKVIDKNGNLTDREQSYEGFELALEPGAPMLEIHFPENARITLKGVGQAIKEALAFYARWKPDLMPRGVFGTGWELDPQIAALLPRNLGLHGIQQGGQLYPCKSSEPSVIRRLFGPDVTRAKLSALPRAQLNSLQLAIVDLLKDPEAILGSRGAFFLREDFERRYREVFGEDPADDVAPQDFDSDGA
ncbi:MAG: ATP-binding cassette domain-containing protein [Methyloceanibacter sp.]